MENEEVMTDALEAVWYTAHIVMYVKLLDEAPGPHLFTEDIYLIHATSVDQAFSKADAIGQWLETTDIDSGHTVDDRPARNVFYGVRRLAECLDLIDEAPGDGKEIAFLRFSAATEADVRRFADGQTISVTAEDVSCSEESREDSAPSAGAPDATSLPDAFTFDEGVSQERGDALTEKLIAYNRAHSPLWDVNHDGQYTEEPLHLFVRDAEQRVIGGLIGKTHALRSWFEVSVLWVEEAYRGAGFGRALMERAEAEARRRGCRYARLSTSSHQAPGFYEKVGYIRYGMLENCPPGETAYYYRKDLLAGNRFMDANPRSKRSPVD